MKTAYFDCFSGVSGNMILGALVDAGLSLDDLRQDLAQLGVSGYTVEASRVRRRGIAGTLVDVDVQETGVERRLADVLSIIECSGLPAEVKQDCTRIFSRLAEAEAKVHDTDKESIHFHEVGALDAVIDVVGSVAGLHRLGVGQVYASALRLGTGVVTCAHGKLPVPAPATLELVRGVPVYWGDIEAELTTPTGAAIMTTVAQGIGDPPSMRVEGVGYGAGHRDLAIPNVLRVALGDSSAVTPDYEEDLVTVVETTIDDMNPEFYDHVMTSLFRCGALDVLLIPAQMKKNRPVAMLSVLVRETDVDRVVKVIFDETTTLGVRLREERRRKLARELASVETKYGTVRVKIGKLAGCVKTVAPEYEDCRRVAEQKNVALRQVYFEASRAAAQCFMSTGLDAAS